MILISKSFQEGTWEIRDKKTQGLWSNWDPGYVIDSILASLQDREAQVWGDFFIFLFLRKYFVGLIWVPGTRGILVIHELICYLIATDTVLLLNVCITL